MGIQKIEYDAEGKILPPTQLTMLRAKPVSDRPPMEAGQWHAFAMTPDKGRVQETLQSFADYLAKNGAVIHTVEDALGASATKIVFYAVPGTQVPRAARRALGH